MSKKMKLPSSWLMVGPATLVATVMVVMSARHSGQDEYKPALSPGEISAIANIKVQKAQLAQQKLEEKELKCKNAIANAKAEADAKAKGFAWYGPKVVIPDDCLPKQVVQQSIPAPVAQSPAKVTPITSSVIAQQPSQVASSSLPTPPSRPQAVVNTEPSRQVVASVQAPKVTSTAKPKAQGVNAIYKRQDVVPGQKTGGVNDAYGPTQVKQGEQAMDAWASKLNQH